MVTNDPISVSRRCTSLLVSCCNLSVKVVVQPIKETFAEVHVSNWINSFRELDATRNLAIAMSPVMLYALHVPLIDYDDNFFSLSSVNQFKEIVITLINENFFHFGEENVTWLDIPVHIVSVQALFGKGSRTYHVDLLLVRIPFKHPSRRSLLESLYQVFWHIETSLVKKTLPSLIAERGPHELKVSSNFFSRLTSKLHFKSRSHQVNISCKTKVKVEQSLVNTKAQQAQPTTIAIVVVIATQVGVTIKFFWILIKLGLWINVAEAAGIVPPFRRCLHDDGVWLYLFNEFLSSLSQHGWLVGSTHQVHIFAIKTFSEVHKSCLKARVST